MGYQFSRNSDAEKSNSSFLSSITNKNKFSFALLSFIIFVSIFILLRLYVCTNTLGLDEAEQIVHGQHFSLGYPSQPPLYTWLQYCIFKLCGTSLFSIALLKYSLIFCAGYCYYLICKHYYQKPLIYWAATLSWAWIPNLSYELFPHRTHVILALVAAAFTWLWLIKAPAIPKILWYCLGGLIIAIGFLSKFNYLLFFAILLAAALTIKEYRQLLLQLPMIATLSIAIGIALPYWFWLLNHSALGFYSVYKLVPANKSIAYGLFALIKVSICYSIGFIALKLFFSFSYLHKPLSEKNKLLQRYHLLLFPFLISMVIIFGVHSIKAHWLVPLFFLLPLWFFSFVDERKVKLSSVKAYLLICLLIESTMILVWVMRTPALAAFPLRELVSEIKQDKRPIKQLVSDSHWLLASLMLQLNKPEVVLINPFSKLEAGNSQQLIIWQGETLPLWAGQLNNNLLLRVYNSPDKKVMVSRYYL